VTSATLNEARIAIAVAARESTIPSLAAAIVEHFAR
jgi:hypothetical protein